MIRSGLGLKALGLCAMLVGMFAFASVAQAETGAFWLVNGAKISESLLPPLEAETDVKLVLLTTLGGQAVDLSCVKTLVVGGHLLEPNGKILGKLLFHECDFLTLKEGVATLQKACEPFVKLTVGGKTVVDKGLIETNNVTGLIMLHEGQPTLLVTPTEGTLFVALSLGEECAFGETLKVGQGEEKATKKILSTVVSLKDCEGKALTDLVKHLLEELHALTNLYINGGETKASLDGSIWAFLGGAHKGLTWAAHAA